MLSPIIKWPGGKEKELKYILPLLPEFNRYFEPFVGGGSVFMAIKAEQYFINDLSNELISLYKNIANKNNEFFEYASEIDRTWENARLFFLSNFDLIDFFYQYRNNKIDKSGLKHLITNFCSCNRDYICNISPNLIFEPKILLKEIESNLYRKMVRMKVLESQKLELPHNDVLDNIETAIKSAVYMYFRHLYNQADLITSAPSLHSALFLFIRNYAYSGMFRYNSNGDFNVPYGGIAYNNKLMKKKLKYYQSSELERHFRNAYISSQDFENFLKNTNPSENDFIFLDPPYDSEFSTYAKNAFTRQDQTRLANYLLTECRSKWMLVIKNTDFIYDLYNKPHIKIRSFEKNYTVSFMNRNDKKVTHLIITNY